MAEGREGRRRRIPALDLMRRWLRACVVVGDQSLPIMYPTYSQAPAQRGGLSFLPPRDGNSVWLRLSGPDFVERSHAFIQQGVHLFQTCT